MDRWPSVSRRRKRWYALVPIPLLLALLFAVKADLAPSVTASSASSRVYANLFEYRMCDARDPIWCPHGDDFNTVRFEAMFEDPSLGSQQDYYWADGNVKKPHYANVPGRAMTRHTVDLCETGVRDKPSNTCPSAHGYDVVTCTDGTRPVFYYEAGSGADANKWIFKIQGGGSNCEYECAEKIVVDKELQHFSSAYNENASTRQAGGIFSNHEANLFKDYSLVILDKCVGDRNLGDATVQGYAFSGSAHLPTGTGTVYFHGYRVILAVLKQLQQNFGLSNADEILFVTQSNGSNGAYHYIDRLTQHVTQTMSITVPVRLLAQSFIKPGPEVEYYFENGSWPTKYTQVPSSLAAPGKINAPNSLPDEACGPGFDPNLPYYAHWLQEGGIVGGTPTCERYPWQVDAGVHGRDYSTQDFYDGYEKATFGLWGVDNGVTVTWDKSCVQAHAADPRPCRDSQHVYTHHLSTPLFFAAQIADRNLRPIHDTYTGWVPDRPGRPADGAVWSAVDMKARVEKLAEVIVGLETRSDCADANIANHGLFIDNTVDHMGAVEMSKLTRPMKANSGEGDGANFELQEYLKYWLDAKPAPTVQCMDSNDLYDVEYAPDYTVLDWPSLVRCKVGTYDGGTQPFQHCDDPGFGVGADPKLNRADDRFVCQGPPRYELTVCASGCDYDRIQGAVDGLAEGSTIILAGETFTESVTVDKSLTLKGAGPQYTVVQAAHAPGLATARVMTVTAGVSVTVEGLTIRYGNASGAGDSGYGGGILNRGSLTLTHSLVVSNSASLKGGGIYNGHTQDTHLVVVDSTIYDNQSLQDGGGIYNDGTSAPAYLSVWQSTVVQNSAAAGGGGIANEGTAGSAIAKVVNSTFSGNAAQAGGGIGNNGAFATLAVTHSCRNS